MGNFTVNIYMFKKIFKDILEVFLFAMFTAVKGIKLKKNVLSAVN